MEQEEILTEIPNRGQIVEKRFGGNLRTTVEPRCIDFINGKNGKKSFYTYNSDMFRKKAGSAFKPVKGKKFGITFCRALK